MRPLNFWKTEHTIPSQADKKQKNRPQFKSIKMSPMRNIKGNCFNEERSCTTRRILTRRKRRVPESNDWMQKICMKARVGTQWCPTTPITPWLNKAPQQPTHSHRPTKRNEFKRNSWYSTYRSIHFPSFQESQSWLSYNSTNTSHGQSKT